MAQVGEQEIRTEFVDRVLKGFAEAAYKFKQACTIASTNGWKNAFYRETNSALSGPNGNGIRLLPRGANFPQASVEWTRIDSYIEKYGLEDNIFWEDILTDDIEVQARTMFRIAEGVTKAVDDQIYSQLKTDAGNTIQVATGLYWDGTSGAIIDVMMNAKQLIAEANYDPSDLMMFISPKDHRSIVNYLASKGAQFPSIGEDMARNGRAGNIAGISLVISNSVTASEALIVKPRICAIWRAAVPLTTEVITDPYKSVKIRAVEMGVTQVTDPSAVVRIKGTQGAF